jgi:NADH:ubiquinone oxidoreductase subunit 4 (subunit M)
MTHSIRKTLLVIAREIITLLPVLAYAGFHYYDRHFEVSFKWFVIFNSTFLCIYMLIILLSSKIKRPITLTEEERNLSPDMYPDYSSSIDWLSVIIWAVSSFLTGIILFSYRGLIVAIVMASLTSLATMVIFYLFSSRNKYTIQENILHVQEYEWSHLTTDLHIPIDNIEKVYISDFLMLTPSVVITVNGIERKLRCTSYSEELAHAIAIRIKQQ